MILSLFYITNCEENVLPSFISPCTLNEKEFSKCLKDQIETALPLFTKGMPELDVPSIDPVHLNNISIDTNGLKLSFADAQMYGLSDSKLTDFKVELGKGEETFSMTFKSNLNLTALYEIEGQIIILPIQGKGDAVVAARGVEVKIDSKLKHVKDSSGEHFKLTSPQYTYNIEKTTFALANLFNGNKQLADTTLQFANENWQQLMDELAPPVIKQIVKQCVKTINKFFSKFNISQIVLGYTENK